MMGDKVPTPVCYPAPLGAQATGSGFFSKGLSDLRPKPA